MADFLGKIFGKKEAVKIGNLTPLSGDYAYYGEWEKRGIDLALGEINKSGGINGREVEIVRVDDRADPVACVEALNGLIHIHKVQVIVGPIGSDSVIADAPLIGR